MHVLHHAAGEGGKFKMAGSSLRESFSSCSRPCPTDLCDLFFFVLLLPGLVVFGDGLTSRWQEGGRESLVLWAAILGPNGYRILEFFRLRRSHCEGV